MKLRSILFALLILINLTGLYFIIGLFTYDGMEAEKQSALSLRSNLRISAYALYIITLSNLYFFFFLIIRRKFKD